MECQCDCIYSNACSCIHWQAVSESACLSSRPSQLPSVILPKLKQFDDLVRGILSAWTHSPPTDRYSPSPGLAIFYNTATNLIIYAFLFCYTILHIVICFVLQVRQCGQVRSLRPNHIHPLFSDPSVAAQYITSLSQLSTCMNKDVLATTYYICTNVYYSCVGVSVVTEQRSIDRSVIISGKVAVTGRQSLFWGTGNSKRIELRFHCVIPLI